MALVLARAPIDEVVVGFVLDQPLGPDAVGAGRYLSERTETFTRHEIHEPIVTTPGFILGPTPSRVWLVSADDAKLIQLQEDRFYVNWRRRGDAAYPGFSREHGVMEFALDELGKFQAFCSRQHDGSAPSPISYELSKIDLLVQGKHWSDVDDVAKLLPSIAGVFGSMAKPTADVHVRWQEETTRGTLAVSLMPARMKADPNTAVYRLEFRFAGTVIGDLRDHLLAANVILNEAFERLIPEPERSKRFA